MTDANRPTKIDCPRCDGTGNYASFGVCYRCKGRGKVNPSPTAKAKPGRFEDEGADEREARLRAKLGDADYEAIHGVGGYWDNHGRTR